MILTVTLNPAIDRTVWVDRLVPGDLHRIKACRSDVAGKGINVSRALRGWGAGSEVIAVLGGRVGEWIRESLAAEGLWGHFIPVAGESRINTKVVDASGELTELNEAGPSLTGSEMDAVAKAIAARAHDASWLVLSGSLPGGVEPGTYRTLIEAARGQQKELQVALDTSGKALALGLEARPDIIKPNREEMQTLLGRSLGRPGDYVAAVREVRARGIHRVVLSLGAEGALFGGPEGTIWGRSAPIAVKSPTGCGDTLLAATLYGLTQGWAWDRCARFAVAAATAAAMLEGTVFPALDQVCEAEKLVEVREA